MASFSIVISDAVCDVGMELAMFAVAMLVYAVFMGAFPASVEQLLLGRLAGGSRSAKKKLCEDDVDPEEEAIAQEFQQRVASGDYQAAMKLWKRVKGFKGSSSVELVDLVVAMQALGKSDAGIANELRAARDSNASLADGAARLMEELRRQGASDLLRLVAAVFDEPRAESKKSGAAARARRGSPVPAERRAASPSDETLRNKLVAAIKACGQSNDVAGAVAVVEELRRSGQRVDAPVYNCLIDTCVQCGDLPAALSHFAEMKRLHVADVVTYNTLVKAQLARGRLAEVDALLREMREQGLPPNKVTYNELLSARVVAQDRVGMWALVESMQAAGIDPTQATCSILLKSLGPRSPSADLARVLALVEALGEPIDEVLLSSLIEAYLRMQQLDQLWATVEGLKARGAFTSLAPATYGSLIKAYGQAGNVVRVQDLWREMMERGVLPTSITVGCTVEAMVRNNAVQEAWTLVQDLRHDEVRRECVNTVIYSTVIKGFGALRQMDRVFEVMEEMRCMGVDCNTITYNTVLDACARCGVMGRVPALLSEMKHAGVKPDLITYSALVKGFCAAGDVDRAFSIFEELRGSADRPDEILFNSLLDGCAKTGRVDAAMRLLEDMRASGVAPSNYTLSILVKLLGRARRLDQAFALVKEFGASYGIRANIQVYTCLIQACAQNRKIEKALAVHDSMIAEGSCQPDRRFYTTLARSCLQAGAASKAAAVVRCAYQVPGSGLTTPTGPACGVDPALIEEVAARLRAGGPGDRALAAELLGLAARGASAPSHAPARAGPRGTAAPLPPWRAQGMQGMQRVQRAKAA